MAVEQPDFASPAMFSQSIPDLSPNMQAPTTPQTFRDSPAHSFNFQDGHTQPRANSLAPSPMPVSTPSPAMFRSDTRTFSVPPDRMMQNMVRCLTGGGRFMGSFHLGGSCRSFRLQPNGPIQPRELGSTAGKAGLVRSIGRDHTQDGAHHGPQFGASAGYASGASDTAWVRLAFVFSTGGLHASSEHTFLQ